MILADSEVAAVAVVAAPDHELGQVPVAYIELARQRRRADVTSMRPTGDWHASGISSCGARSDQATSLPPRAVMRYRRARPARCSGACCARATSPVAYTSTVDERPRPPSQAPCAPRTRIASVHSGTRKRLDHIDAMRPVKQFGVVSTHTLLFSRRLGPALDRRGGSLQLLHVTREAFLFISACMITYSFRDVLRVELRPFWRRRFTLGRRSLPLLDPDLLRHHPATATTGSVPSRLSHLAYLVGTGYYQLYFLVVLLEFYAVFPLLLLLLRRTVGHHGLLLAASAVLQVLIVSLMHWGVLPHWMRGFWATREMTSYQFYLIAGMVVAFHLDEVHRWLCAHVWLVLGLTLASAALAEGWYYLAVYHVMSWLGSSSDPFQPVVIPWNIGAIASIYLLGVWLVGRRSLRSARAG